MISALKTELSGQGALESRLSRVSLFLLSSESNRSYFSKTNQTQGPLAGNLMQSLARQGSASVGWGEGGVTVIPVVTDSRHA